MGMYLLKKKKKQKTKAFCFLFFFPELHTWYKGLPTSVMPFTVSVCVCVCGAFQEWHVTVLFNQGYI